MQNHEFYMRRCLELAKHGFGNVSPNPLVGSVIVRNNQIIGEGYHKKYGQAHAEVNAINSVSNHSLLKEATLYVNLEPCSHYGKTPPCADLIISKEIPRVIIGTQDPFVEVAGRGIERLRNAGIEVITDVLFTDCRELNKRFFTFHEKKRPYIILKWAETKDRFIDVERNENDVTKPTWITHENTRILVHRWRSEEDAIMIGTNTAIKDNPRLDVRDWKGNNPVRIVIDRDLRIPTNANILDNTIKTVVFTSLLRKNTENIEFVKLDFGINIIQQMLSHLHQYKIQSLIVEGGKTLLQSFINDNLWDEARIFVGNMTFNRGISAPNILGKTISNTVIGQDYLMVLKNSNVPV